MDSQQLLSPEPQAKSRPAIHVLAVPQHWLAIRSKSLVCLTSTTVGLVLLVSGYTHLSNPYQFLQAIYAYKIVSDSAGLLLVAFLPFLHVTLGVALLTRADLRQPAFGISTVLLLIYAIAQAMALTRGLKISCGCFTSIQSNPIGYQSIGIAVGACVLSLVGLFSTRDSYATRLGDVAA